MLGIVVLLVLGSVFPVFSHPSLTCASVLTSNGSSVQRFCGNTTHSLQAAIDFAAQHALPTVSCTSGTFWAVNPQPIPGIGYSVALIVRSGIRLTGSTAQATVLKPAPQAPYFFAGVYLELNGKNITVEHMEVDAATTNGTRLFGIGVAATNGTGGSHVLHNYIHHTAADGIQLGYFYGAPGCTQQWNGLPGERNTVMFNRVEYVGWDGIEVDGQHVAIQSNIVRYAMNIGHSNGITCFIDSADNLIEDNLIEMCATGIGLDGSFPPGCAPGTAPTVDTGSGSNMLIRNNTILSSTLGIVFWRQHNNTVVNNSVSSGNLTGLIGIYMNNGRENYIAGNTVRGFGVGLAVEANGDVFPLGGSRNRIGEYCSNGQLVGWGNRFFANEIGMQVRGKASEVRGNVFESNLLDNSQATACQYLGGSGSIGIANVPSSCNTNMQPSRQQ